MTSLTEKSRTLKAGESIAHCSAHPLATHSSKLSVFDGSFPKKSDSRFWIAGTRHEPPTSSTLWMSSFVSPLASNAVSITFWKRSISGAHISRKSSRSIDPLTSMSSMNDSIAIGACGLAESTFFVFSAAVISRNHAFLFVVASILCFSFHSAAKVFEISSSNSRPPKWRSHAVASTVSFPLTNETTETVVSPAPTSVNTTFVGLSSGRSVL